MYSEYVCLKQTNLKGNKLHVFEENLQAQGWILSMRVVCVCVSVYMFLCFHVYGGWENVYIKDRRCGCLR